jgi:hypothetical protein
MFNLYIEKNISELLQYMIVSIIEAKITKRIFNKKINFRNEKTEGRRWAAV